jgi:hypothetical protein
MKLVDREGFILHTEGILLDRDASGRCLIGDGLKYEEAIKELEAGNEIGLLVDGELFSIITDTEMGYIERRAD